jgi:site-specific DNA-methyltransferase (adenine-specific)
VPDEITNRLYYGDNLAILRDKVPDACIDLVYLDPPFNSNRDYNVIFKDESGNRSDAQLLAFEDTWHWGPDAERQYRYLTNTSEHGGRVPEPVSTIVGALRQGVGANQMMAYLVEMAVRLVELHRVLKTTGSLYLHCDPTASHYLKLLLDAVFGPRVFRNEIVWLRTNAQNFKPRYFTRNQDVILFYSKSDAYTWRTQYQPYSKEQLARFKPETGSGRLYKAENLTITGGSEARNFEWRGSRPPANRVWALSQERLEELWAEGLILKKKDGSPRLDGMKVYLDELPGKPLGSVWTDIPRVGNTSGERLGYPTQKPISLLERIIEASSNEGDVMLDPFCGCGTALVAAEKLKRRWIGIDVTYLSIAVMKSRLTTAFGLEAVEVVGQPTEVEGARGLAKDPRDGRYQFQWWALGMIDAQPVGGVKKKGADSGVDGIITFTDAGAKLERVIVSVKSGGVNAGMIRDLKGTLESQQAAIGVFLTLEEPTKPMRDEAAKAGAYHSELWNRDYPRIQILSVADLLERKKKPDLPTFVHAPFKQAERHYDPGGTQDQLPL